MWERGVVDLAPPCIDHATVGAAREGRAGAVLMRDVSASGWCRRATRRSSARAAPAASSTTSPRSTRRAGAGQTRRPASRSRTATRSSGPTRSRARPALGFPAAGAADRGRRMAAARRRVAPEIADALRPLHAAPWPLFDALAATPSRVPPRRQQARQPRHHRRRPHGARRLVDVRRRAHRSPSSRTTSRSTCRASRRPHQGRCDRDAYRAALERHGVDTAPWFDRQLALCLLGVMLQLGWEKAFDETGRELAWWARARPRRDRRAERRVGLGRSPDFQPGQSSRSGCSRTIGLVQRLEAELAATVRADLAWVSSAIVVVDEHRRACGLGEQLRLARALHRDEPPHRLVDASGRR